MPMVIYYQFIDADVFSVLPEWAQWGLLGLLVVILVGFVIWAIWAIRDLNK